MMTEGKVIVLNGRDFHGTKLWSFQIEGNPRWFRLGKKEPKFEEGAWLKFEEKNSNVEWGSIEVIAAKTTPSGNDTSSTTKDALSPTTSAGDVGRRLQVQAARRDAAQIVIAALHTDHLPHAANVAKGKRLDLVLGYVEQVTKALLDQEGSMI